jgi:excisionase family DNA binding protein
MEDKPPGRGRAVFTSPGATMAGPHSPTPQTGSFVSHSWRDKKYITPKEFQQRVYALFGYRPSKSTMHRWLHNGRIEAVRVGKLWLIPESVWEEFLTRCQLGDRF